MSHSLGVNGPASHSGLVGSESIERESPLSLKRSAKLTQTAQRPNENFALPGRLSNPSKDQMCLHTREAARLFTGSFADRKKTIPAIMGGRNCAAAMKSMAYLSGEDNPYADWALVRLMQRLEVLRERLKKMSTESIAQLEHSRTLGLQLSVLVSNRPLTIDLGFRSPYGFVVAQTVVEFDYFVRLTQTLMQRGLLSQAIAGSQILNMSQNIFRLFQKAVRQETLLSSELLKHIKRSDFLAVNDESAVKRCAKALSTFGQLPAEVLSKTLRPAFALYQSPMHSRAGDLR